MIMFDVYSCVAFNGSEDVVSPYLELELHPKCASSPDFSFLMLFLTIRYVSR